MMRIGTAIAAVIAVSTLIACSNDDGGTGDDGEGSAAPQAGEATAGSGESQGDELQELIDAAQDEGMVVWYGVPDESVLRSVADAFTAEYGIDVEIFRAGTGDLTTRYAGEAEAGAPYADVVIAGGSPFFEEALANGWTVPLAEAGVPGLPDEWPAEFVDDERGSAVVLIDPRGIAYNTDYVSDADAPQSWEDLTGERWADELLVTDPGASEPFVAFWDVMLAEYGEDLLRGVGANVRQVFGSNVPMVQALGAGEAALAVPSVGLLADQAAVEGSPVGYVQPDVTSGAEFITAISRDSANPHAARLLVHFLYLGGGHDALVEPFGSTSPISPDLPSGYGRPRPDAAENRDLILDLLGLG